jgi:hypothetical protein
VNSQIVGGMTVALNDGPIRTEYGRGFDGRPSARLVIGDGHDSVAISVTGSPAQLLDQLQAAVAELGAWTTRMENLRLLPEVV